MFDKIKKNIKGDSVIWGVIIVLTIISLLAVYSSTGSLSYRRHGGSMVYFLFKQGFFLIIGLVAIYAIHIVPYKYFLKLSQILLYISVPLLLFTLVMGTSLNSAARWLTVPGLGITIQTSDLAKLALVMYIARLLSLKQETISSFKETFLPIIIPVVIICGLILPANLSTALMVGAVSMILMFIGRIPFKYLLLVGGVGVAFLAIFILVAPHLHLDGRMGTWKNRIENFTGGGDDQDNFQSEQAKIAIATGGILGKGPGNSVQRNFLPHPYSDFIYAIIVEEYGMIGGIVVLALYLYLLFRAGLIVRKCERTFPAFLTIGLAVMLAFQAMINMAVAVNLFPVTGQTLPLVSMGGSSLLFSSAAFGIILSVSRELEKEKTEAVAEGNNKEEVVTPEKPIENTTEAPF